MPNYRILVHNPSETVEEQREHHIPREQQNSNTDSVLLKLYLSKCVIDAFTIIDRVQKKNFKKKL